MTKARDPSLTGRDPGVVTSCERPQELTGVGV